MIGQYTQESLHLGTTQSIGRSSSDSHRNGSYIAELRSHMYSQYLHVNLHLAASEEHATNSRHRAVSWQTFTSSLDILRDWGVAVRRLKQRASASALQIQSIFDWRRAVFIVETISVLRADKVPNTSIFSAGHVYGDVLIGHGPDLQLELRRQPEQRAFTLISQCCLVLVPARNR